MSAPADGSGGRKSTMKQRRSASPPRPLQLPTGASQPQPQPQSPRSPKDRLRRGQSPLTVLIDPPSLDDGQSTAVAVRCADSLTLALEELRASMPGDRETAVSNFFEAHERATRGDSTASATSSASGGDAAAKHGDDDFLTVRPMAKRSSSLKSKKTPPGTPSQVKKAVRFADAFGLDLANIKHVLDSDNPPEIPPQATSDLVLEDDDSVYNNDQTSWTPPAPPGRVVARPAFAQPGHSAGFSARVIAQKVVLESAAFAPPAEICGHIRVANLAFEKSVSIRATFDGWRTSVEVGAAFVPDSNSGMTDQFAFRLALPPDLQPGTRVAFCIVYSISGQTYWDNNFGDNYAFDCATVAAAGAGAPGRRF